MRGTRPPLFKVEGTVPHFWKPAPPLRKFSVYAFVRYTDVQYTVCV